MVFKLRHFWARRKGLIGYLFIVLVAVIAIELHHNTTTGDIQEANYESCIRSATLASNQVFVLVTLRELLHEEAEEHGSHPGITKQLDLVLERISQVPTFTCVRR